MVNNEAMPASVHRIYLGARNTPNHTFLPKDDALLQKTLSRYFRGWTIQNAQGFWEGTAEETRVVTVVDGPENHASGAGQTPFESCGNQLKNDFRQAAVMIERGGTASFF